MTPDDPSNHHGHRFHPDETGATRVQQRPRDDLRQLLLATLGSVLIMSLGLNLFIFKQMRSARAQLALSRDAVQKLSRQYQMKEPAMRDFVAALQAFAVSHADFQPILQTYRAALPQFFVSQGALPTPSPVPQSIRSTSETKP